jgi:cytochrome c biogenesis protein CcdA
VISLLLKLGSIGLLDSTSMIPTAIVPIIIFLGGKRPILTASAFIVGTFVSYLACGLFIALGVDAILDRMMPTIKRIMENPNTVEIIVQIVLGLAMMVLSVRLADTRVRKGEQKKTPEQAGPASAFMFGSVIVLSGIWGALPYFAAIDQILRADVAVVPSVALLAFYNAIVVLPMVVMVLVRVILRERSDRLFESLRQFFSRWFRRVAVALLLLLGGVLVTDGIGWLVGKPLLPA